AWVGLMRRSALMDGSASEMFVRSMKAIVYITKATGMMRSQRCWSIDQSFPAPVSGRLDDGPGISGVESRARPGTPKPDVSNPALLPAARLYRRPIGKW